jgi:pyruvate formate lyase activating enzyme
MKEALFYKKLKNKIVQCNLCPKNCVVKIDSYGNCNSRKNVDGKLVSCVYSKLCAIAIDPIEKKPFYHFFPCEKVFSIGTTGCNLHCKFCQNSDSSQVKVNENSNREILPEELIATVIESDCKIIAYTYNEPMINFEYVYECCKLAKKNGIKNVIVSNGYINKEALEKLIPFLDAANIDLKSFDNNFYNKYCDAGLKPVIDTLKLLNKSKIHLEIINLVIPTLNSDLNLIDKMCKWIVKNLNCNIPVHFSAFHPCYELLTIKSTKSETLFKAKKIAIKNKLNYVYIGNVIVEDNNTKCPKCSKALIKRNFIDFDREIKIKEGRCEFCGEIIYGVFE